MKSRKALLILSLAFFVLGTSAYAQTAEENRPLTKKEKRVWKRKKRKMSVEDFQQIYDQNTNQKAQLVSMQGEIEALENQLSQKDASVSDLQKQVKRMQAAYQAAQNEIEQLKRAPRQPTVPTDMVNGEDFSVGVVFKVQVGAFRKIDLGKYAETAKDFDQESGKELRKYIVGNFRNYEDANVLKRYLREMGVNDAWIVPYRNGQRVPLKEVLGEMK